MEHETKFSVSMYPNHWALPIGVSYVPGLHFVIFVLCFQFSWDFIPRSKVREENFVDVRHGVADEGLYGYGKCLECGQEFVKRIPTQEFCSRKHWLGFLP